MTRITAPGPEQLGLDFEPTLAAVAAAAASDSPDCST
jgi:hypothetical protein